MCGIAAIYSYHYASSPINRDELYTIRDHMTKRGPDGYGAWFSTDGRVGIGHRRLSVIDLSVNGSQPMTNQDGSLVIAFNGEIYNYKSLSSDLRRKGYKFKSESDTEVLLHLYADRGEEMVHALRGMFAFSIWDVKNNKMLMVRDPYGIKPLYYSNDGWTLRVASQVKAIIGGGKVSKIIEPAGMVGFFLTGSIPEPFTLYKEIRQVPAGSYIWVDETGPSVPKHYFSLSKCFHNITAKTNNNIIDVRESLLDSIYHHFISDVNVGIFLSAGIDSGTLVSLAKEAKICNLPTITLAFDEFQGDYQNEAPLAEKISEKFGTKHTTRTITQSEFVDELPNIFKVMDQPSVDGINTYFVSKAAAETGLKVAISGIGGDELFGGYSTFLDIPLLVRSLYMPSRIPFAGDCFRFLTAFSKSLHPKKKAILKFGGSYPGAYFLKRGLFMPWELKNIMDKDIAYEGLRHLDLFSSINSTITPDPKNSFSRVAAMESSLYMRNQLLRDADWAGMAHSLEIRVPLVDVKLLNSITPIVTSIPHPKRKNLLSQSPSEPLPNEITKRVKTGFGLPIEKWLSINKNIGSWRNVKSLSCDNQPKSRRWAYIVMENYKSR